MPRRAPIFERARYSLANQRNTLGRAPELRLCSTENTSGKCCLGRKLMFLR